MSGRFWVGWLCHDSNGSPKGNTGRAYPCRITHIFPGCSVTRRIARNECAPGVVRNLSHADLMVAAERNGEVARNIAKASYSLAPLKNHDIHSISGDASVTV